MDTVLLPDGVRIAYQRAGQGPPLVLVHGTLNDHHAWSYVMPGLSDHFTVYAVDRRGHGWSDPTDAVTYAIERECEDILAVIDASAAPVYLLGHSYGALCALEAALRTTNVRRLVLYEPPIPILPASPIVPSGALDRLATMLAAGDREGVVLTFLRDIAQAPAEAIASLRSSPQWEAAIALADAVVYEVRAVEQYVFDAERLRGLKAPALLVMGSESPRFLHTATEAVGAALSQSLVVTLPGQGHLAMMTAPSQFLGAVVPFLAGDARVDSDAAALAALRQ